MGEIMAGETSSAPSGIRRAEENFRWQGVECLAYKEADAAPFKKVSRQILFADPHLQGELRYFEVAPGGYTTL
ncbi:MAG TPA: cupin domain-containing protein, partial [Methylocella sp.]|nr:cupin domain-containing protein [Methylocella sp.]